MIPADLFMRQWYLYAGIALSTVLVAAALTAAPDAAWFGGNSVEAASSKTHEIVLSAEQLDNGLLAYKMVSHVIHDGGSTKDITNRYSDDATIPGPTIVITEGDQVDLTIENDLGSGLVSVHVHGVHYEITSDGTLEHINMIGDQGAAAGGAFSYHWVAGKGTAGTWPYHDHTFGGINGAENRGLFGTLIVNPASGKIAAVDKNDIKTIEVKDLKKQFVLYVNDDAFWGMEIDKDGNQKALWTNPKLGAKTGDYVRFHLIALGTDTVHEFDLDDYKWLDPGTKRLISSKNIGPLENHVFTIKAREGTSEYTDENTSNELMGMEGVFRVTNSGSNSVPSAVPDPF
jgi:FtsP/CotA-like multicopper oxidase with cupredoxin domain